MDLSPSSYHGTLEELWDEEEEPEQIEPMIKVVPSAYHQYLHVFSKVKAEKIPPNCACDHHIELNESLPHFNPSLPTIVERNASNYALGAVLSQVSDSGNHPIAFYSRKPIPEELNYDIHDKELLGIALALNRWSVFCLSLSSPFEVLTNHSSMQYFISSNILTLLQAFWSEFLSDFHFLITYLPGCLVTLLDEL
ncbi:hypothetical protein O181_029996 [Austropuccinia psidii MF-1]|uniref:Reverse transcriptase RNase H-like domain-containing protein n=1 Tax=Austropuccinia psidii MF-1 TaxID=1389203 RepID=A0A9Q3CXL1_9BASI|nr:hypothetical protein [Austropuccinia psidii MF-1]